MSFKEAQLALGKENPTDPDKLKAECEEIINKTLADLEREREGGHLSGTTERMEYRLIEVMKKLETLENKPVLSEKVKDMMTVLRQQGIEERLALCEDLMRELYKDKSLMDENRISIEHNKEIAEDVLKRIKLSEEELRKLYLEEYENGEGLDEDDEVEIVRYSVELPSAVIEDFEKRLDRINEWLSNNR